MKYFKLFSNCILVKGTNQSVIIDLQMKHIELLPNDLTNIVKSMSKMSVESVLNEFDNENKRIIEDYINYLIQKGYGFYCNSKELKYFTELNKKFEIPNKISNALIEFKSFIYLNKFIEELNVLNCKYIHIISYHNISKKVFIELLDSLNSSSFVSIELTLKFDKIFEARFLQEIGKKYFRITSITFFNVPIALDVNDYDLKLYFDVEFIKHNLESFNSCGSVNSVFFDVNQDKYLEACNYNTCLYKKVSLDLGGNIKNCPAMPQSFGNIKDTTLEEALGHKDFKKYWNITKDLVDVCKDCEFRYVCTDCRAYIEKPNDIYSKPLKCGYNPYTNEWSEWSTNPLKQKAIEYYGMQELVKKDNDL